MNDTENTGEVLPEIRDRRSVRRFDSRPVDRRIIYTCLEAARISPSAEHNQPWRFVVLDEPDIIQRFGEKAFSGIYRNTRWAMKAPVLIILLADLHFVVHRLSRIIQPVPYYFIDIGIAAEHIVLQARRSGLGSCWIGWFDFKKTKRFLSLGPGYRICDLLALGYPEAGWKPSPKKRKRLDEIASFNIWNGRRL